MNFQRSRLPREVVCACHYGKGMEPVTIEIGLGITLADMPGAIFREDAVKLKLALERSLPNGTLIELKRLFNATT